ncbi:MAG: carboxypeptidase-like regulatory domain-containing protein, partial [Vicinamibacteraceae bacterium]
MSTHAFRLTATFAAALAIAALLSPVIAAQTPPGLPDPARLPSRPGLPGPGSPTAPPRDVSARPPAPKGTGAVRGRVVALDTGLPLRRVKVSLRGTRSPEGVMTLSGPDGTFALDSLPADRYELRGSKPRFVDTALGSRRAGGQGRPFELADGQKIENVVLALATAGVITGRVIDDAGETVAGASVSPQRYRMFNGKRQLTPSGRPALTDDTGAFRLFGLPPGRYYLSAKSEDLPQFTMETTTGDVTGYAATFFPSTVVAADAQAVDVVAGSESPADIVLVPAKLAKVSGTVF